MNVGCFSLLSKWNHPRTFFDPLLRCHLDIMLLVTNEVQWCHLIYHFSALFTSLKWYVWNWTDRMHKFFFFADFLDKYMLELFAFSLMEMLELFITPPISLYKSACRKLHNPLNPNELSWYRSHSLNDKSHFLVGESKPYYEEFCQHYLN